MRHRARVSAAAQPWEARAAHARPDAHESPIQVRSSGGLTRPPGIRAFFGAAVLLRAKLSHSRGHRLTPSGQPRRTVTSAAF